MQTPDSDRSIRDFSRLRELIYRNAENADPKNYWGDDWWQMTKAEGDVFNINVHAMPIAMEFYHAYEGIKGLCHNHYYDDQILRAGILKAWPELENNRYSEAEYLEFLKRLNCDASSAKVIFSKVRWWRERWPFRT